MSKLVFIPRRAPVKTRSSDTMDMALLAISPIGGMKKMHTAAMLTPQVNDATARRDWILVKLSAGDIVVVY